MRKHLAIGLLLLSLFVAWHARMAAAEPLSGDYCWSAHTTETENGPADLKFRIKVHLSPVEESYAVVSGKAVFPDDSVAHLEGTSKVEGEMILMNLTLTQVHDPETKYDTGILRVRVKQENMNGAFWGIVTTYDPALTKKFSNDYSAGTLKKVKCATPTP
jgi:hypothetical protein